MSLSLRNGLRALERAGAGTTPAAGTRLLYPKADGWYGLDSAGVETKLGGTVTGTKVSALTAVTTPAGTDEIPVNQGGTTKKLTLSQVSIYSDPITNTATSAQGPGFAADTYVTGTGLVIPQARMGVGVAYYLRLIVTKTAASAATPTYTIRYGTNGSTADTARCSFTQTSPQTGNIDTAWIEVLGTFRVVGASAVLAASIRMTHDLAATGWATKASYEQSVVSAAFDSTVAGSQIGLSMNGGTSSAWTVQQCIAQLHNLAA
jgi:hypothetical protein